MSRRGETPNPPVIYDDQLVVNDDGYLCCQLDEYEIPLRFESGEGEFVFQFVKTGDDPEFEVTMGDNCSIPPLCGSSRPFVVGPYVDATYGYASCEMVNGQLEAKLCIIIDNDNIWAHEFVSTYVPGELISFRCAEFEKL